jgi:hypothetical protein
LPGKQDEQLDEPAMLWPLPQLVHVSVAPVLNVLTGQISTPALSLVAMYPALAVAQYAEPTTE